MSDALTRLFHRWYHQYGYPDISATAVQVLERRVRRFIERSR